MKRFEVIESLIAQRWGEVSAVQICKAILDYIVERQDQVEVSLTFSDFSRITGFDHKQDDIYQAIAILVTRFKALDMRLVYIDEDNREIHLDKEEQKDFIRSGELSHPDTGLTVDNASEHVFPYYIAEPKTLLEEVDA